MFDPWECGDSPPLDVLFFLLSCVIKYSIAYGRIQLEYVGIVLVEKTFNGRGCQLNYGMIRHIFKQNTTRRHADCR